MSQSRLAAPGRARSRVPARSILPAASGLGFLILLLLLPGLALGGSVRPAGADNTAFAAPGDPPDPQVTLDVPASVLIGEPFAFTVTFDNASTETGFGPFVDLVMPALGADLGVAGPADGITFVSATYLGTSVAATVIPVPLSGCVTHPLAVDTAGDPVEVCGLTPGDEYVVLRLPFGSFTGAQPAAAIRIIGLTSELADAGTPLPISARGGFQFGATALSDPATDPSVLSPFVTDPAPLTADPSILRLTKTYLGPEDETATGPNFPRQYRLTVDIADGQTITDLDITDLLPQTLQFVSVDATTANGSSAATTDVATPASTIPGGTLTRRFASVTGTPSADDATVLFTFYVPLVDSASARVIDPDTADEVTSADDARTAGQWDPIDERDPPTTVTSDVRAVDHRLTDRAIAIQKSALLRTDTGPSGVSPGDTLEWTLDVQVSDFFAFDRVRVFDGLKDGTRLDSSYTPRLSVAGNGFSSADAAFQPASVTVVNHWTGAPSPVAPIDGSTAITFDVSAELSARGETDRLIGGCIPATGGDPDCAPDDGPTWFRITFRSIVQNDFSDDYPSGDPSVDQGDVLRNVASVTGWVLDTVTLGPTGHVEGDGTEMLESVGSGASAELPIGDFDKTIHAVNGSTSFATPVHVAPGDTVTYRLREVLPTSDIETFRLTDYLPLPIFAAGTVATFDDTTAGIPAAGHAQLGPDDTFRAYSGIVPTMTADIGGNSLAFDYGSFNSATPTTTVADILFTVRVSDDPFADGLLLTNQGRSQHGTTNNGDRVSDSIVQVTLDQPVLTIIKGVVATDADAPVLAPATVGPVAFDAPPSAACPRFTPAITSDGLATSPVDSDLADVDAGDVVTFALVIENTGHAAAFDIELSDPIPAGFDATAGVANLCVTDGAGTVLATTDLGGGLAGSGIRITGAAPALAPGIDAAGDPNDAGTNVAIVTYDLVVDTDARPGAVSTNTGSLDGFAGDTGADSHLAAPLTDDATVTFLDPAIAKALTGTSEASTADPAVAIGERLTYTVVLTIPEGTLVGATVTDTPDTGVAFAGCTSITRSSGALTTDLAGGFDAACDDPTNPAVGSGGGTATFDLGTIVNADTDDATVETLTIVYVAVVTNSAGNDRGAVRGNSADLAWTEDAPRTLSDSADPVRIAEPALTVVKTAAPTTADAGDEITFTIVVSNPAAADASTAFEAVLADQLPAGLTAVPGSLGSTGVVPTTLTEAGGLIGATWAILAPGESTTIELRATLDGSVEPGEVLTNTADATWTSLPGDVTVAQSPYAPASTERTGDTTDPGADQNDHRASGSATVRVEVQRQGKSIVATSEASTGPVSLIERVAIGEIVRYRLAWVIPEGTATDLRVVDTLPDGLRFLDDGTAKVAFISDGADMTSTTLSGTGLAVDGSAVVAPTFAVPSGAISGGPFVDGTDPVFTLGTVLNPDSDVNAEYVVIELNALVTNVAGNQSDTSRDNGAEVRLGTTPIAETLVPTRVVIAEPALTLAKTVTTTPLEAGDTVVYALTFTNGTGNNVSTAFDVRVLDVLDSHLVPVSVVVTPATAYTDATAGNTVDLTIAAIAPGTSVTVTVTATVAADAPASLTIPNTANATWTSLPGGSGTTPNATGSTTPGAAGSATGERTGSGTAPNDHLGTSSAPVSLIGPTIDKRDVTPAAHPVGKPIGYTIAVTVPNGTTPALVVTDALPDGLAYVAGSATVDATLFGGTVTASPVVTGGSGSGSDVVITLGDVTSPVDAITTNDTFLVTLQAVVVNELANQDGRSLSNTASMTYTNPDASGTLTVADVTPVTVTVIEPVLRVVKTIATPASPADAGGLVTYRLTIDHLPTSTADAFDVSLVDVLPGSLTYVPGSLDCDSGALDPTTCTESGGSISVGWNTFPDDGSTTIIELTASINYTVTPGTTITNSASMTWTSMPGTVTGERTGADGPGGALNDHAGSTSVPFTTSTGTPVKTVAATSEASTGLVSGTNRVAVGEIVRYQVAWPIPEGTATDLNVLDVLPAGLRFLDDGTAKVAFISDGADMTSTTLSGTGLAVDSSAVVAPTFAVPSGAISGGPFVDSTDPVFTLGTVLNPDSDVNAEYVVIELNALVTNVAGNQSAPTTTRGNLARIRTATTVLASTGTVNVVVAEPALTLAKTVTTTPLEAGDTVVYALTFTNGTGNNVSTAFDVRVLDVLDSHLVPVSVVVTPATAYTDATAGNTVDLTIAAIAPGTSVTVTVTATVAADAPASLTIPNTANATWTSLPGGSGTTPNATGSTTPGAAGSATGERTGSGTAPNDHLGTSSAPVSLIGPTIDKRDVTPAAHPVGKPIGYTIAVTVPNGTTPALVVTDALPDGLAYVAGSATVDATLFGGTVTASPVVTGGSGSGSDVVITLGDVTSPVDAITTNDTFLVTLQAVVVNELANQDGRSLSNTASMTYTNPDASGTLTVADATPVTVTVIEPVLTLTKVRTALDTPTDAGALVTYRLTISHDATSTADAFDVTLTDVLPTSLVFDSIDCAQGTITPTTCSQASGVVSVGWNTFPRGTGTTIIDLTARVAQGVAPLTTIGNTASMTWTSMPGTVTGERTGADGPGGALDDHAATASASTFTTASGAITKALTTTSATHTAGSSVAIGETVTYTLTVRLPEGTIPTIVVTDTLPAGMTYVSGSAAVDASGLAGTLPAPTISVSGAAVTASFGSTLVTADNDATNDSFTVAITAVVDNVSDNQDATALINGASVVLDGGTALTATPVTVTVVEPELTLTKARDVATPAVGDTVTYTLTVGHAGASTADALDAVLTDVLPVGLQFVAGSLDCDDGALDPTTCAHSSGTITATWAAFPDDGSTTLIRFQAVVGPPDAVTPGSTITNRADLAWTSLAGTVTDERTGADGVGGALDDHAATSSVSINPTTPDLSITKTPDVTSAEPDDTIVYALDWANVGDSPATGVTLTETVPADTTFSASSSTAGWSCADGDPAGTTCTFDLGTVSAAPSSGSVGFAVTVDAGVATTVTRIDNTVTIGDDGTHGVDPTPLDRTDDATTPLGVAPGLRIVKDASVPGGTADAAGDVIDYTITVENTGNQTLTDVTVTDPFVTDLTRIADVTGDDDDRLEVGETWAFTASHTVTQAEIDAGDDIVNTATADSTQTPEDTDDATVPVTQGPGLRIVKDASVPGGTADAAGDVIDYTITVENTGNQTLTGVTVTDPFVTDLTRIADVTGDDDDRLEVGETWAFTASHTVTQAEIDAGDDIVNTATADSTQTPEDTDDATVPVTQGPGLRIVKDASVPGGTADAAGDVIDYTITVENTGNQTLTDVTVTDPFVTDLTRIADVTGDDDDRLEVGETWAFTASHTVTQAEIDAGDDIVNTATADSTQTPEDTDDATVPVDRTPRLRLVKTGTFDAGADGLADPDELISYSFVVTNTGNVALTGVTVSDPLPGLSAISCPGTDLAIDASMTCSATYPVTRADIDAGSVSNTATADSTESAPDDDDATTPLGVAPGLRIVKDASVPGGTADAAGDVIDYTITVENTGNQTLTDVTVTDPFVTDLTRIADVTGDDDDRLEVGETWAFTASHTVTQAEIDAGDDIVNTATADSTQTPEDTDDATVPVTQGPGLHLVKRASPATYAALGDVIGYTYEVTNSGNVRLHGPVTVADDKVTVSCPRVRTVGNLDVYLDPGERVTCTASHSVTQADLVAGSITNHATAQADGTTSNRDQVTVDKDGGPGLPCDLSSVTFSVPEGKVPFAMLTVTVTAKGPLVAGCKLSFSLASYHTDGPTWPTSGTQVFLDHDGGVVSNRHPQLVLTVAEPPCFGQTDFYPGLTKYDGIDGPLPHYPDSRTPEDTISWSNGRAECDSIAPRVSAPDPGLVVGSTLGGDGDVQIATVWSATDAGSGVVSTAASIRSGIATWSPMGRPRVSTGEGAPRLVADVARWLDPADGAFRVRARASDAAGNRSAWVMGPRFNVSVWQGDDAAAQTAGSAARIEWSGGWTTVARSAFSGGTAWRASGPGAKASLTVTDATDIGLVAPMGPDRGRVRIVIDGKVGPVVDLHAPTAQARSIVWAAALSPGRHVVEFVVLGHANPASSGAVVTLDAFLVMD